MKITSYPITRDIRIGRIKSDPCEIVFVLNEDGTPMDLTGKVLELVFLTGNHAMLTLSPDDIDGNKAVFALTEEEKNKLYANLIYISVKLDGVTIGEGRFEWGSTHGDKSELPKAIGINVNNVTESIEWFEVIIGPRGPKGETGKSAYEYAAEKGYAGTEEQFGQDQADFAANATQVAADAAQVSTDKGIAVAAKDAAAQSASDASQAKTDAQTAKTGAIAARTGAEAAETGAVAARAGAQNERVGAETARTGAEVAETGAVAARTGAQAERVGAQTARTGAEVAETGAVAARNETVAMKDSYIRNESDVFGSKLNAMVSLNASDFQDIPLKLITTLYFVSKNPTGAMHQVVKLTQAEYDALGANEDPQTVYVIPYTEAV